MDDNKAKALSAALSQIEKQFGKGSIMRMGIATLVKISKRFLPAHWGWTSP